MKRSMKQRYHLMLGILLGLIVAQFLVILFTISQANNLYTLASDIQSILIFFLFVIFIYMVVMFNYLPYRLSRSINKVKALIDEISNGNYQIDIDSSLFEHDSDFEELLFSVQKMLDIIMRFDAAKADKIYEHHQRISQLINLLPELVMIATVNGDIVYINDVFRAKFPAISETTNLNEVIHKNDFYTQIFETITESLRFGNNVYDHKVDIEGSSQTALIKGSIIRNRKGTVSGGVYILELIGDEA